jgi:hypothetical protein
LFVRIEVINPDHQAAADDEPAGGPHHLACGLEIPQAITVGYGLGIEDIGKRSDG